jgi:chromosomal replication initiation ATPase DnaA
MEQVNNVLKYIKLYTNCSDHTLKRIKVLLDNMIVTREVVKVVRETKEVYIHKKKSAIGLKKWAEQYMLQNNITYKELAEKNRKRDVITMRNKFCVEAYKEGYGASEIGRYLKRDHTTILHCIHKIKRINK